MDPTGFLARLGLICLRFACICGFHMKALIPLWSSYSVVNTANKFVFSMREGLKSNIVQLLGNFFCQKKKIVTDFFFLMALLDNQREGGDFTVQAHYK